PLADFENRRQPVTYGIGRRAEQGCHYRPEDGAPKGPRTARHKLRGAKKALQVSAVALWRTG
ncbi:hypothetical protein, partial [Sedimenticola sp.]|uniref:hypothetical protein n=1 Tax=Sedimenticola sp. TaxID=1940285 RepID=UPI003D0D26DF